MKAVRCSYYSNTVTGDTFTLVGVDSLTGTANDDTFNAANALTPAGGPSTGDVVNGGAGTDTLNHWGGQYMWQMVNRR